MRKFYFPNFSILLKSLKTKILNKKYFPALVLIACSILLTVIFFFPVIGHLNTVFFSGSGDGVKNYFTYLFYIANDSGTHFTGMNYPFGENVVFTDNMPLLAWLVKWLSSFFPGVAAHALGIMHLALLSAITIGVYFLYKILKHFDVADWFAIPSALFIIFCSPQILKICGHFGMAYLMYLPMQLYWLMRYDKNGKWKYPVFIAVTTTLFTFLHVYNLAFTLVLVAFYVLTSFFVYRQKGFKYNLLKALPMLAALILSSAVFAGYLKLTDTVTDRTTYPCGVFGAATVGADIFLSRVAPLGYTFQFLFGKASYPTEGYAYIGFVTILVLVFLIGRAILALIWSRGKYKKISSHPVRSFRIWLWVALWQLLFAMGIPFIWGMDFLADYVAAFRQFRTMGRFSWSFYYLLLVFTSIFIFRLYHLMRRKHYLWQAKCMIGMVFIIWSVQLSGYVKWLQDSIGTYGREVYAEVYHENEMNWTEWLQEKGYQPSDFQAILALPFFHIGSEKLWLQDNDEAKTFFYSAKMALQTHIPIIDVMMSRTSWTQTFSSVLLTDGMLSHKPLLDSFSDKKLMILVNRGHPLQPKEEAWIKQATFIGERADLSLYAANVQDVALNEARYRDSLRIIAAGIPAKEGLIGNDTAFYYVDHFDDQPSAFSFRGKGAFMPEIREREQLIADIPLETLQIRQYLFSVWTKCNDYDYLSPYFIFRQYDKEGNLVEESDWNAKYSTNVTADFWFLSERMFDLKPEAYRMRVYVISSEKKKTYIALDELAFWPLKDIYYYKTDDHVLLLNNRPQFDKEQ